MFIKKFEQYVSYVLIAAVILYISFQVIVLFHESFISFYDRVKADGFQYTQVYGKNVFIIFFNILLALEVLETVKVFNKDHDIKIRIILIVCMIAVSRKILSFHIEIQGPESEMAVALLVISLSASYYLITKTLYKNNQTKTPEVHNG